MAMLSKFFVWRPGLMRDGFCKLNGLQNVPKTFKLLNGDSRAADWPDNASAAMSPNFPKDIGLLDTIYGAGFLVLSPRTKQLVDEENLRNLEWLPVSIVDHKGRTVPESYSILNPREFVDCIDAVASQARFNPLKPTQLNGCVQLVLREDAIPADVYVFRPSTWPQIVIIRRELGDKMVAAGLTGLDLREPAEYDGLT